MKSPLLKRQNLFIGLLRLISPKTIHHSWILITISYKPSKYSVSYIMYKYKHTGNYIQLIKLKEFSSTRQSFIRQENPPMHLTFLISV